MYTHFTYKDGSNPYISFTNKKFFKMICKYHIEQVGDVFYRVTEERKPYKKNIQSIARNTSRICV